mmetsp:Transcript_18729/g.22469  ORF Transcript_18729/g.22469 Transcript_18729/m.22469 type:complete len:247 (-) Transcript_18729:387-1127(-)
MVRKQVKHLMSLGALCGLMLICEAWTGPPALLVKVPYSLHLQKNPLSCQRLGSSNPNSSRLEASSDEKNEESLIDDEVVEKLAKREIVVSTSLEMPFPPEVAFDAFSNLERQPSWSNWLKSVKYVDPAEGDDGVEVAFGSRETKWTVGFRGISFSWTSISTRLERPRLIEWESTSGMKNQGQVIFESNSEGTSTDMTLKMTFVTPRFAAAIFRRSGKIANFVENKMLKTTLVNFCDVVMAEDLQSR